MSRVSRICSVIDCGSFHHAAGFCKRHYNERRSGKSKTQGGQVRRDAASHNASEQVPEVSR